MGLKVTPEQIVKEAVNNARATFTASCDTKVLNSNKLELKNSSAFSEVEVLQEIIRQQEADIVCVEQAVSMKGRDLKAYWLKSMLDDTNFTDWGQFTPEFHDELAKVLDSKCN